ncbi:MAG: peptidyl-prolyl cis-trans isomerase [Ignavibacteriae bacterium]|nr:peptidyl-prolyl cis-trans isomerase [Ignavibacteriota bacterium]
MKIKHVLVLLIIIAINIQAQKKEEILAKVGDKVITAEEFKFRYEFTPQINRKNSDNGKMKSKEELLYTLIAENLYALEAEKLGYDTTLAMQMNYIPMEKMHVRDALYLREIKNKVKTDDKKITEGLWLANHKRFVDYLYTQSKDAIDSAYSELQKSNNFDSTAALLKNVEYVKEPYEVTFGKMFKEPEQAIFNLELNEYTAPQESPEGWYIFRLLSEMPVIYKTVDQKMSLVRKTVEDRYEDSVYNDFWGSFFKDQKVTTNGSLFWYFAETMQKLVEEVKTKNKIDDNVKIDISSDEFIKYKNSLSTDSLSQVFIRFEKNPLTFNDFLNEFIFEGFTAISTDFNTIMTQLNNRVKRQIELELLARYGYKLGLESLDDVKNSTEIWKKNYLATLYRKDLVLNTKLSDSELTDYLKQKGDSVFVETKVNIIEVLTDSLDIIKQALAIADNEDELRKFAIAHTKRNEIKNNNGEFGFFSTSEFGEIGKIAGTMEVGDVYGPLQIDGSYSVFKLIGKENLTLDENSKKNIDDLKLDVLYNKAVDKLENKAVDLAEKYGVAINEDLLNSLQLNNLQMLVYRYMGFGGRTLAFPYSSPFFKWKEKWEQKKKDLL